MNSATGYTCIYLMSPQLGVVHLLHLGEYVQFIGLLGWVHEYFVYMLNICYIYMLYI